MDVLDAQAVYQQNRDMVYGYLFRLCRDSELAQELTQETFYQALKKLHQFRGESSVGTWLCAIARNQYHLALRKPKALPLDGISQADETDVAEFVANHSLAMSAYKVLHHMEEPYREVFTLRTFCELSHRDIAELFGKSESWARVTYYRAKRMLAVQLKGENAE